MTDPALLHKLQDEQYLYRLSSTFAWDEAIQFCNSCIIGMEQAAYAASSVAASNHEAGEEYFDEYLDRHFHSNQINNATNIRQWIRYVYKQIAFSDQWGNTPLHSASFCKPPVDMIAALFRLARALRRFSSRVIDSKTNISDSVDSDNSVYNATNLIIWAATCRDGSTPFLVAASTGASTEVLHCYLDEIQYYIDNDWSDDNNLKEWARKTVIRPDFSGTTPLMGWMAYHDVWIKRQLDPSSHNRESSKLTDYWELTQRMLQFATKNDLVNTEHLDEQQTTCKLVQQCASISLYCPISLLEWVVSPYRQGIADMSSQSVAWTPADICAATPDRITGKLPFHVAMEARPFSFDLTSVVGEDRLKQKHTADNPRLERNRIQIIKKLLTWYPDAANVPFKLMKYENDTSTVAAGDNTPRYSAQTENRIRSRSPFLQAIAFGMTWWHTVNTADFIGEDYIGLVQLLWGLNAGQTTSKRDDVSGLYPFMLAAATATTTATTLDGCHDDRLLVDTTYNLLKKDPELVTGALNTKGK